MNANSYVREPVRHPPLSIIDVTEEANHIGSEYHNMVLNRVNSECLRLAVMTGEYCGTRAEMRTANLCFEALAAETVFLDHDPRTGSV